jgi:hypothetical protein
MSPKNSKFVDRNFGNELLRAKYQEANTTNINSNLPDS